MAKGPYAALDVGERRIGVALADDSVKIAVPYDTLDVDGTEVTQLVKLLTFERIKVLVIGYPRNQAGESTQQTVYVQQFVERLPKDLPVSIVYQDESLTSVHAEQRLKAHGKPYTKADIDSSAASIILQDYLEQHGRV